ncbi:uncharacterized protein CPUR_07202 [Claviceps purpurea 20.1]|uniref:Uncharacterized protein n=1 Tax=Claviceps purpurea (strain 20.1) TaxID=1111077 RepID=M1WF15_CLAP2|nr:hypothetical protein E4U12_002782 [Claviceps purpurea]KAG6175810.1 hypothetical protein E4U27_005788 [Claviceps purpurea]KAG6221384.1 hypothetical protein E4U26_006055 [Claviceps purpurea]CCE33278.1 uncharacterized protein CPUR_07202 [Claviceps purpurea 20.1]
MNSTPIQVRGGGETSSPIAPRPSLQSLPAALLEKIFLYSMSTALPRASPAIGVKLSPRSTRLQHFMNGFHDTWDQCFGVPKMEMYPALEERMEMPKGDPLVQSVLLILPWVDIDFILDAQQAWADKYARGRRYRHYEDNCCELEKPGKKISHASHPYYKHAQLHKKGTLKFDARACFEADYQRALQYPARPHQFFPAMAWGALEMHPYVRVPDTLITGPWTEEKKRRLFWLVRAAPCLTTDPFVIGSYSPELRLSCIDTVVLSAEKPDTLIFNCLFDSWIYEDLPKDKLQGRLANLCKRIKRLERTGESPVVEGILRDVLREMDREWQFEKHHLSKADMDKLLSQIYD